MKAALRIYALSLAMAALLACSGSTPSAKGSKKEDKKERGSLFGRGIPVANTGVREPSGIAFHPRLGRLFVVGDEGTLAELDAAGRYLTATRIHGDLEDVTVHTPSGDLVLVDEDGATLLVFDPVAHTVKSRWRLDADELVGKRQAGREGFEGVGFRPEAGRPGGGVFYLTHQRGPAMLVEIAFDPEAPPRKIKGDDVLGRWKLEDYRDLTSVTWSAALDRLLVLADSEDQLLVVKTDGVVEAHLDVPGLNQEGVCLDAAGDMWIADDRGGSVVRYAGALAAIEKALYSRLVK